MKERFIAPALILTLITAAILPCLSGCNKATVAGAIDLMSGISPQKVAADVDISEYEIEAISFAVRLFQHSVSANENSMISPVSVLCALAMTANGADGNTLAQMQEVFGLSIQDLNEFLHAFMENLQSDNKCKLSLVNSVWFKDDPSFQAEKAFLQINADYFGASIYKAPFNEKTLKDINTWVKNQTDGMIEDILDEIPPLAVMYLINAVAFDAEWQDIYKTSQVRSGSFNALSGEKRDVKMMYSFEYSYLDDSRATGFIKRYSGGRYAFAALLPNEGISIDDYISSLTGAGIAETLRSAQTIKVDTAIPKFESRYNITMNDALKDMGMPDAFDSDLANLRKLGASSIGNLYIGRVIHKSFISVDERGTKAGASTVVEIIPSSMPVQEETKTVHLDRPFVYMIIDSLTGIPLFIGTVLDL